MRCVFRLRGRRRHGALRHTYFPLYAFFLTPLYLVWAGMFTTFPFLELPALAQALVFTFFSPLSPELPALAFSCRQLLVLNPFIELARSLGQPRPAPPHQPLTAFRATVEAYRAARAVPEGRLDIAWGGEPQYWRRGAPLLRPPRARPPLLGATTAQLLHVWWLDIRGALPVRRSGAHHAFLYVRGASPNSRLGAALERSAWLLREGGGGGAPPQLPALDSRHLMVARVAAGGGGGAAVEMQWVCLWLGAVDVPRGGGAVAFQLRDVAGTLKQGVEVAGAEVAAEGELGWEQAAAVRAAGGWAVVG